jgi:hypothetical protein
VSALKGHVGQTAVSVGDGGTVYVGEPPNDEPFTPGEALRLAEMIERGARHYDADSRTLAEQTDEQLRLVTRALLDANDEAARLRTAAAAVVKAAFASADFKRAVSVPTHLMDQLSDEVSKAMP